MWKHLTEIKGEVDRLFRLPSIEPSFNMTDFTFEEIRTMVKKNAGGITQTERSYYICFSPT